MSIDLAMLPRIDTLSMNDGGLVTGLGAAPASVAASRCVRCGSRAVPPVEACAGCSGTDLVAERLPGEGTLYAFARVHVSREPLQPPYVVGYVDHPAGVRIFARIAEPPAGELRVGMPIRLTARLEAVGSTAPPWAPIGPAAPTPHAGRE